MLKFIILYGGLGLLLLLAAQIWGMAHAQKEQYDK